MAKSRLQFLLPSSPGSVNSTNQPQGSAEACSTTSRQRLGSGTKVRTLWMPPARDEAAPTFWGSPSLPTCSSRIQASAGTPRLWEIRADPDPSVWGSRRGSRSQRTGPPDTHMAPGSGHRLSTDAIWTRPSSCVDGWTQAALMDIEGQWEGDRTPAAPLWTPPPPPSSPSRPRGAPHTHVQPWAAACSAQPSPLGYVLSSLKAALIDHCTCSVAVVPAAAHLSSGMSTTARLTRSLPSLHVFPWFPAPHGSQHLR